MLMKPLSSKIIRIMNPTEVEESYRHVGANPLKVISSKKVSVTAPTAPMARQPLSSKIIRIMNLTEVEERLSSGLRSKLKDKEEKKEKKNTGGVKL